MWKVDIPEVTQQEMLFKLAGVDPKIPHGVSVDGKLCRHEHIGGEGKGVGGVSMVKIFAVIVLSKKPFPAFLTLEKCLRGHDIKSFF